MAKTVLKKSYLTEQFFDEAQEAIFLAKSGSIISATEGMYLSPGTLKSKVTIDGQILAETTGIYVEGAETRVIIGKTGMVFGDFALALMSEGSSGINNGTMIADDDIVYLGADDTSFVNNGKLRGEDGIKFIGDGAVFTNGVKGVVQAWDNAVQIESSTGDTTLTINNGRLESGPGTYVFLGGDSNDTFVNKGTTIGLVDLGDGDDVFDARGGVLQGTVIGRSGDDVFYTDKASLQLLESIGGGQDSVYSTVDYVLANEVEVLTLIGKKRIDGTGNESANDLFGNAADNILVALGGIDILDGGKGNDRLTGGEDSDTFIFSTGYGVDTITDFLSGSDRIDLRLWAPITDFDDLIDNHATDKSGNVELRAGKDRLIIEGTTVLTLDIGDFIFN